MGTPEVTDEALDSELAAISEHKTRVHDILQDVATLVKSRGTAHDRSKLSDEELPYFAAATDLKKTAYGSDAYKASLKDLGPALAHHYKNNRHHPEHHDSGISDMNIVDIIEMLGDWLAAGERHGPGHDIFKSINYNRMRFKIGHDLARIMWNTAKDVFGKTPEDGCTMVIVKSCIQCNIWQDPKDGKCSECGGTLRTV